MPDKVPLYARFIDDLLKISFTVPLRMPNYYIEYSVIYYVSMDLFFL